MIYCQHTGIRTVLVQASFPRTDGHGHGHCAEDAHAEEQLPIKDHLVLLLFSVKETPSLDLCDCRALQLPLWMISYFSYCRIMGAFLTLLSCLVAIEGENRFREDVRVLGENSCLGRHTGGSGRGIEEFLFRFRLY